MKPELSVIMVDGGFRERFDMLASWESQTLDPDRYELIWVEYTDRVAPAVADNPRWPSVALGRDEPLQQLAYAYNEGIRRAAGDIIVLPDADVYCSQDLLATVLAELSADPQLVLYVLRLDQLAEHCRADEDFEHLKATCTIKHTYNFGGCTAVHRERLIEMNGYEQLPIFAGYHYNGGDNYIRFKNMGLKIRWHPAQRVYHPWHDLPPGEKFATADDQDRFLRHRAATWDVLAYDGLDASRNRPLPAEASYPSDWPAVMTERGAYRNPAHRPAPFWRRVLGRLRRLTGRP